MQNYLNCTLCPRRCGADRSKGIGFCAQRDKAKIARVGLHMWEEPPISGQNGSGTVFFSGCQLKCVFCQNFEISQLYKGVEISDERLAQEFLRLQDMGAENINLVSPTPFLPSVMNALDMAKPRLKIPVVMNSGGYETLETIDMLDGYIDVYLPDFKYSDPENAKKYSGARDYPEVAQKAIGAMQKQVGKPVFDERGMLKKGVIIRHLILPGCRKDSIGVIGKIAEMFEPDDILLSIMRQYTPMYKACEIKELSRKVSTFEYNSVMYEVEKHGFQGYSQGAEAVGEGFVPDFDFKI